MEQQHRKLQAQGISSIPVHSGRRLPDNLEEELIDGKYRAVFMSPEDAFSNKRFDMLWNAADWRSRVQAIIIDEAHCITTLHGELLQDVRTCFHFDSNVAIIRADTDRPNVRYEVEMTEGSISTCYDALEAYLDSKKTIVYFDNLDELLAAYRHLLSKTRAASVSASASASATPIVQPGQIAAYFADLASETKMLYMSMFRKGEILMLLSTEAAEMGCDHPDILRAVQFRAPSSISVLAQRLGRAARAPDLQGTGILL
ncbi:hypothetical protein DFQ26_008300 [Actinomortierella ambigua]|nr:hypothetical protein DFQ26_008300 [Actinomortierella ambigua]